MENFWVHHAMLLTIAPRLLQNVTAQEIRLLQE